jgi:ElaB/YqjD/DUF883 family membrane-anchored ribosome-binding protein
MAVEFLEKPATVEDVVREFSKIKSMVSDAVDDGVRSAMRTVKQGRGMAEDVVHDAKRVVRQNPFEAVGIFFAAGVVTGALVAWMGVRRR